MIDLKNYELDEYASFLLSDIRVGMSEEYLNEVHLSYKGKHFSIEPVELKVVVFGFGQPQEFDSVDDMLENCKIDGKKFMEAIEDMESLD